MAEITHKLENETTDEKVDQTVQNQFALQLEDFHFLLFLQLP